jgi:hypothetical protein
MRLYEIALSPTGWQARDQTRVPDERVASAGRTTSAVIWYFHVPISYRR